MNVFVLFVYAVVVAVIFAPPFFRLKAVTHRENKQPGLPPPYFTKQQQEE